MKEVSETVSLLMIEPNYQFNPTILLLASLTLTIISSFNSAITLSLYLIALSFFLLIYFNKPCVKIWVKVVTFVLFWTILISVPLIFYSQTKPLIFFTKSETFYLPEEIIRFILKPVTASAIFTALFITGGAKNFVKGLEAIKIPKEVVELFSMTILFIPIFARDAYKFLSAREARIVSNNIKLKWGMLTSIVGDMLFKGLERANNIKRAIEARRFSDDYIEIRKDNTFKLTDLLLVILTAMTIILFYILNF
ncbi:MAG: energy-coupling factor transporter transmembrane component T [Nitrososphaeria archaeon]